VGKQFFDRQMVSARLASVINAIGRNSPKTAIVYDSLAPEQPAKSGILAGNCSESVEGKTEVNYPYLPSYEKYKIIVCRKTRKLLPEI
jgi:hypothetical protein